LGLGLGFLSKLGRQNPRPKTKDLSFTFIRVSRDQTFYRGHFETLRTILTKVGFSNERAAICARLFAETSRDGVYSHGLNRLIT
jgi:hypothetical protein